MEVILANFLRLHKSHDAWRYFIKKKRNATPKDPIKPPEDKVDKPNKYFLSELLQISISFQETKLFGITHTHTPHTSHLNKKYTDNATTRSTSM
jgi:hypothetical protein